MRNFTWFKLISLFSVVFALSQTAWSHQQDISGAWFHDGQPTSVNWDGNQYLFCNENRECVNGFLTNNRTIQVPRWFVTGTIHHKSIEWSNGTRWVRYPNPEIHTSIINIDGQWFHHGQPTQILLNRHGNKFSLINELGQSSVGYIQGNTLTIPSLHLTGYLSPDGNQIFWSNNTKWVR